MRVGKREGALCLAHAAGSDNGDRAPLREKRFQPGQLRLAAEKGLDPGGHARRGRRTKPREGRLRYGCPLLHRPDVPIARSVDGLDEVWLASIIEQCTAG